MEEGKKMAKYIDRDQFIDWLKTEIKFKDLSDGLGVCLVIMKEDFEHAIKHMPDSIIKDVAPVKHGHWISLTNCSNSGVYCSVCHKKVYKEDYAWCNRKNKLRSNYCPNCGADMRGESDEEY